MITTAIIAEYNPFHNGHLYQLNKAKELTGAQYVISVMSGNFLQRGIPAMWDKYSRAKMAVASGIDMVLELPFVYATGSAYDFAMGAVSLLNKLNTVNYLCFGAETDDLECMNLLAQILTEEPASYKAKLQNALANGKSYPAAREYALLEYFNNDIHSTIDVNTIKSILSLPNNTLALEYICALVRTNSNIKPVLIKRDTSNYHDDHLQVVNSSANAIRKTLLETKDIASCANQLPEATSSIIEEANNSFAPITKDLLTEILQGTRLSQNSLISICDFDNDLIDRFHKLPLQCTYDQVVEALTTKNKTTSRISRALIHYLLGYTQNDRISYQQNGFIFYASLLAFNKNASELIKLINNNGSIKIITKKADYLDYFEADSLSLATSMWHFDTKATELYNTLVFNKYNTRLPNDYQQSPIIL